MPSGRGKPAHTPQMENEGPDYSNKVGEVGAIPTKRYRTINEGGDMINKKSPGALGDRSSISRKGLGKDSDYLSKKQIHTKYSEPKRLSEILDSMTLIQELKRKKEGRI